MNFFWEIAILMVALAIGSIGFGWYLGYQKRNKELTKEIIADHKAKYYDYFKQEFNKRVEERAIELVKEGFDAHYEEIRQEIIRELKEADEANESTDSD